MKKILIEMNKNLIGLGNALSECFEIQYISDAVLKHIDKFQPDIVILEKKIKPYYSNPDKYTLVSINNDLSETLNFQLNPAVDLVKFGFGRYNDMYKSDFLYISEEEIGREFLQRLCGLSQLGTLKCFGPHQLDIIEYLGKIPLTDLKDFLASAKYTICYNNNLIFESLINKSNPIATKENIWGIPTLEDLENKLDCKSDFNPLENDTYHHRAIDLLKILNLELETNIILEKLIEKIQGIQ